MNCTCDEVMKLLEPFSRNVLPDEQAEVVRGHVRRCSRCEERLSDYVVVEVLATHPEVLKPREPREELLALAAAIQTNQHAVPASLEEIINEWREHFGEPARPAPKPQS